MNICTDFPHPAGQAAFAPEDRPAKKLKTTLDKSRLYAIITERSGDRQPAAVAQSVERVIGNDEVGSSNLPSSSKNRFIPSE